MWDPIPRDQAVISDARVLITGGCGFIGSHLVRALEPDNEVRILDIDITEDTPPGTVPIVGDIRDAETVAEAMAGVDIVFHQAASVDVKASVTSPKSSHETNVTGTLNVLEAAREENPRLVVASSAAVYGDANTVPIAETAPLEPNSPYGLEKSAADQYTRLYHDLYGLDTVPLRYFNVYGPGQRASTYSGVITNFVGQARRGDPITIYGDGEQTRDFIHVDDVVTANLLAATTDAVGKAYNVGTGKSVTVEKLAKLLRRLTGSNSEIVYTDPRPGDVRQSCAETTRAQEGLGFTSTVHVEDGLTALYGGPSRSSCGQHHPILRSRQISLPRADES